MSSTPGSPARRVFLGWYLDRSGHQVRIRRHDARTPSVPQESPDSGPTMISPAAGRSRESGELRDRRPPGHAASRSASVKHPRRATAVLDGAPDEDSAPGHGPGGQKKPPVGTPAHGRHAAHHGGTSQLAGLAVEDAAIPADAEDSARTGDLATLGVSAVFALTLIMVGAGYLFQLSGLRLAGVLGVVFFGAGTAPLQLSARSNLTTKLGVAGVLGFSILTVLGSIMVLWSGWHPLRLGLLIAVAAVAAHCVGCRRAVLELRSTGALHWPTFRLASLLNSTVGFTFAGTVLWCVAAFTAKHITAPGVLGFLAKISPLWFVGLVLLLAAVVFARGRHEGYSMVAVTSLLSALTLTPAVIYGTPRSQAAGKHIDLVLQILSQHHLDRSIGIYQAYSGFFSAIAWVCNLAHVANPIGLAACWPFVVGLVALAELRFFFGQLFRPGYRIWAGITLVVLVNAIGADYFSPQSVGFVLGIGVYGLVLGRSWPGITERWRIALLTFAGCSLAVTHELSPYIVGGVLIILAVFRVIRPWYVPATVLVPALLWAVLNRGVLSGFIDFQDLGDLSNFAPPKTVATPGLSRLPIVNESSHALALGLLVLIVLALIGFYRSRRDRSAWAYIIAPGVGLVLIAANPYGNEGIFRASLFAIPWLAVLALAAAPPKPPRWLSAPLGVLALGLLATYLIAMFGLDNATVIRTSDLRALAVYQQKAADNSDLLIMSYGDIPNSDTFPQYGNYIQWFTVASPSDIRSLDPTQSDLATLTRNYIKHSKSIGSAPADQLFALWSPATAQYAVDYGLQTSAQASRWRTLMIESPDWHVVFSSGGTYLFRYVPHPAS